MDKQERPTMADAALILEQGNRILEQFSPHEHFCRIALDAYVVVDISGRIVKYNSHFTKMTKLKTRILAKANSLDDILRIEVNERFVSISELLRYRTPGHIENAIGKLVAETEELNLVIGIFPFLEEERPSGAFVLIRDNTAETNLQGKFENKAIQSITDKLTGLFNRGHFDQYLPTYLEKIKSHPEGSPERIVSLVILDIDHFKKCNDAHGHQAGDYVISRLSSILKSSFGADDMICRYGGEEFVAILPGSELLNAKEKADAVRCQVEKSTFEFLGRKIPITISLGVAEVAVGQESGTDTLARADLALYTAKKSGRNRVCWQIFKAI
jgi:diguanylate cyclase (GGDEF)-like protein